LVGSNAQLVCFIWSTLLPQAEPRALSEREPSDEGSARGQIDGMCDSAPNVVPQWVAGSVRARWWRRPPGVGGDCNPDAKEAGCPDFNLPSAGTPSSHRPPREEIVAKANAAVGGVNDPAVRKKSRNIGAIPPLRAGKPAWMDNSCRSEVDGMGKVVRAAGVKLE